MAVNRRGYIFGVLILSIVCVLAIVVSAGTGSWITASARENVQNADSLINYGLFRGSVQINTFITPAENRLYMVCVSDLAACALSCKTDKEAREQEVRALAQGQRPNPACLPVTNIEEGTVEPPVISFALYISIVLLLFLQLAFAVVSTCLAIANAVKNPTEPVFGLPGCLWCNVVTAVLGMAVLLTFGIYYTVSELSNHLAIGYIALGHFNDWWSGLGFSYWLIFGATLCSLINVVLLVVRRYLLERDPPPPTIKVENHSDDTIFLY